MKYYTYVYPKPFVDLTDRMYSIVPDILTVHQHACNIHCLNYNTALRWGIECNYKSLKSILQIENFTSVYPILIEQDFYATVLIANLLSIPINETNQELSKKLKDKEYKNYRNINSKAAFSILKPIFMQTLCESNPEIAASLLKEAQLEILNFTSVVKPNRSFQRKKKHSATKFNFSTK